MEVEAKILEVDAAALTRKLVALGAKKTFDGTHEAYFFDTPAQEIYGGKRLLRLRREKERGHERVVLTVKIKARTTSTKRAQEFETLVASFAAMRRILEGLGYGVKGVARKRRVEYKLKNVYYCLDTYKHIPTFLEIEATSEHAVFSAAKMLGFKESELKPWSGKDVLRHYGEELQKR